MNHNKISFLMLSLALCSCTTTAVCPKPGKIEVPQYEIYKINQSDSNSEKAKAIVISWKKCVDYSSQLSTMIENYE